MTDDNIRAAWEAYHGPVAALDGYIPATPPTYSRGYEDGVASVAAEVRAVLGQLDNLAEVWGDECVFRTCRDRLRALVAP